MMRRAFVSRFSVLLAVCFLSGVVSGPAQAETPCSLAKYGDCCAATVSPKDQVRLSTDIVSGETVEYVVFKTRDAYSCTVTFDGDVKFPMRVHPKGFIGTWVGGKATLKYESDTAQQGACNLDIFRMSIKNPRFSEAPCGKDGAKP